MKNYIAKNYYEQKNGRVYARRDSCIKHEGSAVEFDVTKNLDFCDIVNGELVESKIKKDNLAIESAYNEMVNDIYQEMHRVFKTKNTETVQAEVSTCEAMIKRPESYVSQDIGFNSEDKVIDYANAFLAKADLFAVFRLKKLNEFKLMKSSILEG